MEDWLRCSIDEEDPNRIHPHGESMAVVLQAVFDRDGGIKPGVQAPFGGQLGDDGNEL